jgi:hypothetical protein
VQFTIAADGCWKHALALLLTVARLLPDAVRPGRKGATAANQQTEISGKACKTEQQQHTT